MAIATVTVRNNLFPRIADRFPAAAAGATNKAMARTLEVSTPLTPVDKGPLRANVVIRAASASDPSGEMHWAQEYAGHQEYGTVNGIVGKRFVEQGVRQGLITWQVELQNIEGQL